MACRGLSAVRCCCWLAPLHQIAGSWLGGCSCCPPSVVAGAPPFVQWHGTLIPAGTLHLVAALAALCGQPLPPSSQLLRVCSGVTGDELRRRSEWVAGVVLAVQYY